MSEPRASAIVCVYNRPVDVRTCLESLLAMEGEGFEINAEILAKLIARGARIVEVPARLGTREFGESKLDTRREVMNHLRLMRRMRKWRRTSLADPW